MKNRRSRCVSVSIVLSPPNIAYMKNSLFLLLLVLVGCQQSGGPISQTDKDEIQKTIDAFTNAIRNQTGDFEAVYTEEIVSMPPNAEQNSGKQKVTEFHNTPGPKPTAFTISSVEINGVNDLGYARGTWEFKGILNDTIEINDNGKFIVILKKQSDGTWRTSHEIWNSNLPLPGQ
jgi:ketosteroid isomerase-like protein